MGSLSDESTLAMADGTRGPPLPPLHRLAERAAETDTNLIDFFHGDWSKLKAGESAGPVFEETPEDKEHVVYGTLGPLEVIRKPMLFPRSTPDQTLFPLKPDDFAERDAAVAAARFAKSNSKFSKALIAAAEEFFTTQKPVLETATLGYFSAEFSDTFYLDMGPILLQVRVDKMVSKLRTRLGYGDMYLVTADVPRYATWQRGFPFGGEPHFWEQYNVGFTMTSDLYDKDLKSGKLTNIGLCNEDYTDDYQLDQWTNPKLDENGTARGMVLHYQEENEARDYESFMMRVAPPTVAMKVAFARITVRVVKDRAADTGYVDKPFSMKFGVPHDWEGGAHGWTPEKFSWLRERLAEFPVFDLHQLRDKLADIERTNVDAAAAASFAAAGKRARTEGGDGDEMTA